MLESSGPHGAEAPAHGGAELSDLKHRLIAAARDLLEREGRAALTLRAAARAVGVSHMAPYRHFSGKDELLAAVAEQGFQMLTTALDAAAAQAGEGRPGMEVGVAYVLFARDNPSLYRLMFGADLEPCSRFPGLIAAGQDAFARCIAVARAAGHDCVAPAEGEPPPPVAAAMWSLVHGLSSLAIDRLIELPNDPASRRDFIAQVVASAFGGRGGSGG